MQAETMRDLAVFFFRKGGKNCAEAVFEAWQKVSGKDPELKENLSICGSGRAPQGLCGAIYAAQLVSGEGNKDGLSGRFADAAGSLLCGEIRAMRKLSCTACVELAAGLLEKNMQQVAA